MCYTVLLSTTSEEDLSVISTELLRFERAKESDPLWSMLAYDHKWFVGSKSGCGCTFRHLTSVDLGFHEPEDWCPEDVDSIQATIQFVKVVRDIVARGGKVDCIEVWQGPRAGNVTRRDVDLGALRDEEFRFFENHHFVFTHTAVSG